MKRVLVAAAVLTVASCAKAPELNRNVPMGDRLDPLPPLEEVPVHGHTVTVEARVRNVTGELLGLDETSVWVLEPDGGRGRPVAVPRRDIRSVGVVAYASGAPLTAGWAAAGTVSTLSHGFFLIFSGPLWAAVGLGTSVDESLSNDLDVDRRDLGALAQYARFPQGMSPELLSALTHRRRRRHPRPAPTPPPAVSEAPPPPPAPAPPAPAPPPAVCASAALSVDLRALPTGTSASGIDLFVSAQADELASKASAGPVPRILRQPGSGLFEVQFDAPTEAEAVARCEQAVAAYLPGAPRLPILMQPAVQVTVPCAVCSTPP